MAYQYQTFSSGQVFTGAQAQQIEDNIRDHIHGKDGVSGSGVSWSTTSKGAAFSITSADAGTLFKCWGDFAVTCPTAATLGGNFGAGFINAGSGRVVINAASGQWINGNSCYALTPGEGIVLSSDTIELEVQGGRDRACLYRGLQTVSSLAQFDITRIYPLDFTFYELIIFPASGVSGLAGLQVSFNSGTNFLAAGYSNSNGAQTDRVNLNYLSSTSRDHIWTRCKFAINDAMKSVAMFFEMHSQQTARHDFEYAFCGTVGVINALRFVRTNSGYYTDGTRVELWGQGRVRR